MAVNVLRRLAAASRVCVFPVAGAGARVAVQDLRLRPELELVASPRHASVLLVAGRLPRSLAAEVAQIHDQLPHPRATVWWTSGPIEETGELLPLAVTVRSEQDITGVLVACHRAAVGGARTSEPRVLPDVPPAAWKGVGPFGQGGEGMMGGAPYGRPMPMAGEDRDGLAMSRLSERVGPFFAPFPPGLVLDVTLQGDVVQHVAAAPNPFAEDEPPGDGQPGPAGGALDRPNLFRLALARPVPLAHLELARARSHLRWLAHTLDVAGLAALGVRVLRLATSLRADDAEAVAGVRRTLDRALALAWVTRGVGRIDQAALRGTGSGPVARAAGLAEDARLDHPAYRDLGFQAIVQEGSDVLARWRQRLAEAEQSVRLAAKAGESGPTIGGADEIEGPRGRLTREGSAAGRLLDLLPDVLPGMEWGEAVATVTSLDLDLDEIAARRPAEVP